MFCGKYITEVPKGYFAHLDALRGDKGRAVPAVLASQAGNGGPVLQGDAKGVNGGGLQPNGHAEPLRSPADREDIRRVLSFLSFPLTICLLGGVINMFALSSIHNVANDPHRAR